MSTGASASSPAGRPGLRRQRVILVTGAAGEVGHGLVAALAERRSDPVVVLDIREPDPAIRHHCLDAHVGDVCDASLIERLLATYEIGEIHHLAALLSTRAEYSPETAHEVNVGGTMNLLRLATEQARSHGSRVKFLMPSSIAAHGVPDLETKVRAGAVLEDEYLRPITMYGVNKLYCEHLGRYYQHHYRQLARDRVEGAIDFRCIRYPGLISADTIPSGGTSDFAPEMIHAAVRGEPYACFVREDARIPFMTMPEAIDATLQLADAAPDALSRNVYNVGSFAPSAGEIADAVRARFPEAEITFEPDAARAAIVDSWPADVDSTAAKRDFGFAPRHDLASALDDYLIPGIIRANDALQETPS